MRPLPHDISSMGPHTASAYFIMLLLLLKFYFRIADQTGRFAQYYDGDIIREVNSIMLSTTHVMYDFDGSL